MLLEDQENKPSRIGPFTAQPTNLMMPSSRK
jgi:hypothetical protein